MAKTSEPEKTRGNPLASSEEKGKALEAARLQIEKQYGAGSLIRLGDHTNAAGIEIIPTGSILLDEALGIGGYPRGRIIEIFGPESSGKTTLALHAIAQAQRLGGIAAFVDAEHALDPVYAKNLGVNIEDLWISQPDSGEQALEITDSLVRSGAVDVIVVDSVAALTPQAEIQGDMGDAHMGLQARLMSQALRKLTATIGKSRTILIFINQIRMKIGVLFGNPETTTGGNALKFYASVRIEVRKTEMIEKGDADAVGNKVRVKVVKNKVAPPFRKVELEMIYGKGISATGSLLDAAVKYEIIDKKGAWFSYGEEKIGQGRDSAREYLENNPGFAKEVEDKLRKQIFPGKEFPVPVKAGEGAPAKKPAEPAAEKAPGPETTPAAGPPEGTEKNTAEQIAAEAVAEQPAAYETAAENPVAAEKIVTEKPAAKPAPVEKAAAEKSPAPKPPRPAAPPGNPYGEVHRGPGRPRKNPLPADHADGLF
jgi:recombination protein RecA